jgi:hypothetical protein
VKSHSTNEEILSCTRADDLSPKIISPLSPAGINQTTVDEAEHLPEERARVSALALESVIRDVSGQRKDCIRGPDMSQFCTNSFR